MDRRRFLGLLGAGAVTGLSPGGGAAAGLSPGAGAATAGFGSGPARPEPRIRAARPSERRAQQITLTAEPTRIVHAGGASEAWTVGGTVPGPILRLRQGETADILLENRLPEPTILHWHGLDVPEAADGHPRLAVGPGESYAYRFRVDDPPGLYWYHPHTHGLTAPQTYRGLAGLLVVEGEEDEALGLPSGPYELPLVLRDRRAEAGDPYDYTAGAMGPDAMMGYLGDTPYANERARPNVRVERGTYRLRLLNASNARLLELELDSGDAMLLVGTDGGLLPSAVSIDRILMGTGERADLLVDFSRFDPGARVVLRSRAFQIPGMMAMGMMGGGPPMGRGPGGRGPGGMMGGMGGLPQGSPMDFVTFEVGEGRAAPPPTLPARLRQERGPRSEAGAPRRTFRFESAMMRHAINGRSFELDRVDVEVPLGRTEVEVWTLVNDTGFAHPVHVHAGRFRVLARSGGRAALMPWESGLKDTVLVLPGERVEIAVRFDHHAGLFLLHCHNLEHEDAGMMANFRVVG